MDENRTPTDVEDRRAQEECLREIRGQLIGIREDIRLFKNLFAIFAGVGIGILVSFALLVVR